MSERHMVVIVDDDRLLDNRYPQTARFGSTKVAIRSGRAADLRGSGVCAGIVDSANSTEVVSALRSKRRLLLASESLSAVMREVPGYTDVLLDSDWIPYLPIALGAEVAAAVKILRSGTLGKVRSCRLTTYVGASPPRVWEQDAPFARSLFESIVFGLDLLVNLFGAPARSSRWLSYDAHMDFGAAIHYFDARFLAIHEVMPSGMAASPLFTTTVNCESGRILLRDEFAPGALAVWEACSSSFRCAALPREKANVQAPDTVLGGLETIALIASLEKEGFDGPPTRGHAVQTLRHALDLLGTVEASGAHYDLGDGT